MKIVSGRKGGSVLRGIAAHCSAPTTILSIRFANDDLLDLCDARWVDWAYIHQERLEQAQWIVLNPGQGAK